MKTKVIFVEGLPGSGKSSTAQFIAHQLQRNNTAAQWYFEMGMENPADYCFEACLNEKEYKNLISKFSLYGSILDSVVEKKNDKYFIKYILLERMYKDILPEELIDEIAKYDIKDREAEIYTELGLLKWEEFNSFAKNTNQVTVLESNFLQGPTVELLLRDKSKAEIKDYIHNIYKRIKDLNPALIYFYQKDIDTSTRKMLERDLQIMLLT